MSFICSWREKFNSLNICVGSRVINNGNHKRKGWKGTVISKSNTRVTVLWDNEFLDPTDPSQHDIENGVRTYLAKSVVRHFLKIPNEERQVNSINGGDKDRFWMVWRFGSGVMAKQHESQNAAQREAERLAAENPGKKFYVLKAQSVSTVKNVITTHYD